MKARYFGANLSHEFFAHLSMDEKQKIYADINKNKTVIYTFEKDENQPLFIAVIDIMDDRIHVREVAGDFIFRMKYCEKLCIHLCEKLNKPLISFCTEKDVVRKIGERLGFTQSKFKNEFEKVVVNGR